MITEETIKRTICDLCKAEIDPRQMLYNMQLSSGPSFDFHAGCAGTVVAVCSIFGLTASMSTYHDNTHRLRGVVNVIGYTG